MFHEVPDIPVDIDFDIYETDCNENKPIPHHNQHMRSIWDEINLDRYSCAQLMHRKLFDSGMFDLKNEEKSNSECDKKILPDFPGVKSLAMVHNRMQMESIGLIRAAATKCYQIEWQNWCGYETNPEKLIGRKVQVLGLYQSYQFNESCGEVVSFHGSTKLFSVKLDDTFKKKLKINANLSIHQKNLFYEFQSSSCCPFTPLCCLYSNKTDVYNPCCCDNWVKVKYLILFHWNLWKKQSSEEASSQIHYLKANDDKNNNLHTKLEQSIKLSCHLGKLPIESLKLVFLFSRPHRSTSVLDFTEKCRLRVKWRDPKTTSIQSSISTNKIMEEDMNENNLSVEEIESTNANGRAGTSTFEFFDCISVAMELHCMNQGYDCGDLNNSVDYGDILEGGIARLARLEYYHKLFWSCVLYYHEFKTCFPLKPSQLLYPVKARTNLIQRENMKIKDELVINQQDGPIVIENDVFTLSDTTAMEVYLDHKSRIGLPLDFVQLMENSPSSSITNKNLQLFDHHGRKNDKEEFPNWMQRVIKPWDRVFQTMFDGQGEPHSIGCIFYCSNYGCTAPPGFEYPSQQLSTTQLVKDEKFFKACPFSHDVWWKEWALDLSRHRRLCQNCGKYAQRKCSRCKAVFYCTQKCQQQQWSFHKKQCPKLANKM